MESKIKHLISLAGVKYAIHLGEELSELKSALADFRENAFDYGQGSGVQKLVRKSKLETSIIAACFETFDVLWLVEHLGIARYLKVELPYHENGCSKTVSGKLTVVEDGPYLSDDEVGLLQRVLRFRNVLLIDKAFDLVKLMSDSGTFEPIYNEWVAEKVSRGWNRNDYSTTIQEFDFLHSNWVRAFGVERSQEGRSDSELFISGMDLFNKALPYYNAFIVATAHRKAKVKWVLDKQGFLQRREDV